MSGPRPRRVPQRTCIACKQVRAKRDLVRIVRGADGQVSVDPTGRKPGRGAYLCRQRPCWDQALARGTVERALKTTLVEENRAALRAHAATMPESLPSPSPSDGTSQVTGQSALPPKTFQPGITQGTPSMKA